MVVVVFNNQVIGASSTTTETLSDPIPMGGNDRVTAVASAHWLFGGGASPKATIEIYGSNDGTSWTADLFSSAQEVTAAGVKALEIVTAPYAFVRFKLIADPDSGSNFFMCLDVHANVDHA